MKRLFFITITLLCLTQAFALTSMEEESTSGVDRYAIYIGSNKGGKGREQLLYAGSDAQNFQKAMSEIGGVTDANSYVLIDPTKENIDDTLNKISKQISTSQTKAKRSEFIFYYSGHSDENSLLLGDIPYDYSELKAAITEVPSDIHVVILDSCYSGNFIRTKGGQKRKPFLIDDSSVVTGHAYLSSSSTNEYSQESDEIESSYFTNAMITGLRGAADTSGDNKVTLNELYSYAFNDTLSKTESSKAGPQHPNYNITLVGSGDLVLSDISNGEAMLSLSKEAKGKFIIRNAEGKLISEINKVAGQPIFMALAAGQYSAIIIDEYSTKQGYFLLEKDQIYVLDQNSLSSIKRKTNRVRGGEVEKYTDDDDGEFLEIDDLEDVLEDSRSGRGSRRRYDTDKTSEDTSTEPPVVEEKAELISDDSDEDDSVTRFDPENMAYMHISVFPGVSILDGGKNYSLASYGIFGAYDKNVRAVQLSGLMNITSGSVYGMQISGLFNIAGNINGLQDTGLFNVAGNVNGLQVAGLFNRAKDLNGGQISGLFNVAEETKGLQAAGLFNYSRKVKGVQLGVINIAEESDGIALGVVNIIKDGMHHIGFTWDTNGMFDVFFHTGTKRLFVTFGHAHNPDSAVIINEDGGYYENGIAYVGLGTEFRFWFSSIDLEFLGKFAYDTRDFEVLKDDKEMIKEFNFEQYYIPSCRVTWNLISGSHFDFSTGATFDLHQYGQNDLAFDLTTHKMGLKGDDSTLYTSFFIGFKIK